MIQRAFIFIWLLFKNPKLWFLRAFFWRKNIKFKISAGFIIVNDLDKEKIYFKYLLENWYLNPSANKLDQDLNAILELRSILLFGIKNGYIEDRAHEMVVFSIKICGKHGWEILIDELAKMTKYFNEIHDLVLDLLRNSNLKVRETALLVMEDGNFTKEEISEAYLAALGDVSKSIKIRGLDLIGRESIKFRNLLRPELSKLKFNESDPDILDAYDFLLSKK